MYPRATVKKIVKAHSNCNVSKNADVTVSWAPRAPRRVFDEPARADLVILATQMFLDYIVFMQTCANTCSTIDLHECND